MNFAVIRGRHKGTTLYTLVTLLLLILYLQGIPALTRLEYTFEDQLRRQSPLVGDRDNFAIVGIDSQSIAAVGEWPWNHGTMSDLLITICDYQPQAVMLDFPLVEKAEEFLSGKSGELALSIRECGNVVIPFDLVVAKQGKLSRVAPSYLRSFAIPATDADLLKRLPVAAAVFIPPKLLAAGAKGVGFSYYEADSDDKIRCANLLINYEGSIYPSAPLQLAAICLGSNPQEIALKDNRHIHIAGRDVPIDNHGRMLLRFPEKMVDFRTCSAIDVLTGEVEMGLLAGKTIIITTTEPQHTVSLKTAAIEAMPAHAYAATIVQNVMSDKFVSRFELPLPVDLLLLLVIGITGTLILPGFKLTYRLIILATGAAFLLGASFLLFASYSVLLPIVYPLLTITLLLAISPAIKRIETKAGYNADVAAGSAGQLVATGVAGNEEVCLNEIPIRLLLDEKPSAEAFQETIQLDFQALTDGNSGAAIQSHSQPKESRIDPDAEIAVDSPPQEEELTETSAFIPDLPDTDLSRTPAPYSSPQPQQDMQSSPFIGSTEVKFSSDGQPLSFGRYHVIEPVGFGAMGTVYKGRDPAIDRWVALKTIRLDAIADESEIGELRERLTREAKAAGKLSHPNIVTIYDVGVQQNLQYIAMEYLEGYTLEALMKRNLKPNYRIIASIMQQVCSALEYAHGAGIVHRDVKPANIMVLDDFHIKVMDFGIALTQSASITQTGVTMGTPNYISPEVVQGKQATAASDIFNLGVVLYEMITHRKPFIADNITSLIYQIVHEEPPPPTSVDQRIPPLFDFIIKKALAKNPQERYASAKEFASSLKDFTADLTSSANTVVR